VIPSTSTANSVPVRRAVVPAGTPPAVVAEKSAAPAVKDHFEPVATTPAVTTQPDLTAPLTRALFLLSSEFEKNPELRGPLVALATKEFAKSPEAMALFRQVMPYLESSAVKLGTQIGAPVVANVAKSALPLVADGQMVQALLKGASEIGGVNGRRLVGAALRGLSKGTGVGGAAAELAATGARIAANVPALGGLAGGVAKALPVIGNAANVLAVGRSLKALHDAHNNKAPEGHLAGRWLHLAATVTACFIPPASALAIAIDVKDAVAR
jgi:hypothetical protein